MIVINGKKYPIWSQFVKRKQEWIGGILEDFGDSDDRAIGITAIQTKITDIKLEPNGDESAFFSVDGENFGCGFDIRSGVISGDQEKPWITFSGYGGHKWRIRTPS